MHNTEFLDYWHKHYPLCPPLGPLLREAYPELWFRIHALPESKRYPETDAEYQEILHRHNTLLADLFGDNQVVFLLTTGYSGTEQRVLPENIDMSVFPSELLVSLPMHQIEKDETGSRYWHIWMCTHRWMTGSLDDLLCLIADDRVANVLVVDSQRDRLYHPYDGGADIILGSQTEREYYRSRYIEWLSPQPTGL